MLLLVGGYTVRMDEDTPGKARGVSAYDFSPASGQLEYRGFGKAENPSYILSDPQRKTVYAVKECLNAYDPGLNAFRLSRIAGGKIAFEALGEVPLDGDHPCHLAYAERTLIVSCYTSGSVHVFSLDEDGRIGKPIQRIKLEQREREPHAHCALYDSKRSRVYVCDLGSDCLRIFERDGGGMLTELPDFSINFAAGDGPRHIDMHPDGEHLLLNCEHRGRVAMISLYEDRPREIVNVPSLPERAVEGASGAALRLGSGGRDLYISERNYSVITALRVDTKRPDLQLRDTIPSGGLRPRDIILSPDGKWLISANLKDHSLGVFRRGPGGGLVLNHVVRKVPSPTSLCWMPGI